MLSNQWVTAAPPKRSRNTDLLYWNAVRFNATDGMPLHIEWEDLAIVRDRPAMPGPAAETVGLSTAASVQIKSDDDARSIRPVADAPSYTFASIGGEITAEAYLPGADGFYQGTRFEQPMVHSLVLRKPAITSPQNGATTHNFYGKWFNESESCASMGKDDGSCDFIFKSDNEIIAGPLSAGTGPVDCFGSFGWDAAKPGSGSFFKVGVGALLRPAGSESRTQSSDMFLYNITDRGDWQITKGADFIEFVQTLDDSAASGYGYVYTKRVSLIGAEMTIARSLKNTGTCPIESQTFTHNFLTLDRQRSMKGTIVSVPFAIEPDPAQPPNASLVAIGPSGKSLVYQTTLSGEESFYVDLARTPKQASENVIEINSTKLGAGMRITGDYDLPKCALWSIRTTLAAEPFVNVSVAVGAIQSWTSRYEYYTL